MVVVACLDSSPLLSRRSHLRSLTVVGRLFIFRRRDVSERSENALMVELMNPVERFSLDLFALFPRAFGANGLRVRN